MLSSNADSANGGGNEKFKEWGLSFLRSPVEFTGDSRTGKVSGVKLEINRLEVSALCTCICVPSVCTCSCTPCVCVCVRLRVRVHVHVRVRVCVRVHVSVRVHMCTPVYTCTM